MQRLDRRNGVAVFGFTVLVACCSGKASLIGSTVDVSANFPGVSTVFADPGSRTVSSNIEYPAGSYANYNGGFQIDLTSDQFILTNTAAMTTFQSATFNGFVLKILSGPAILAATIDPTSGFSPISATVVNGNEVDINYSGVPAPASFSSIINIQTSSIPEPTAAALACLVALLPLQRRRPKLLHNSPLS